MVRLGRVLVFLGVAVWPVWGILFLAGSAPNVGWALLAHLALVVPGGTLVRRGTPSEARPARQRLGTALIAFGVTAWVPYFILREQGVEVPSAPFLAWHLSGVIPGSVLRYTRWGWRAVPDGRESQGSLRLDQLAGEEPLAALAVQVPGADPGHLPRHLVLVSERVVAAGTDHRFLGNLLSPVFGSRGGFLECRFEWLAGSGPRAGSVSARSPEEPILKSP
jgi:hypothetical protein